MQELEQGRRSRLSRIVEILEACNEVGEHLNLDVIAEVLDAADAELDQYAAAVPAGARALTDEEHTIALLLCVVGGSLENAVAFLERRSDFFRLRNELAKLRDKLGELVGRFLLARMRRDTAMAILTESGAWRYLVLTPEEAKALPDLLEHVAGGGRVNKPHREAAAKLMEKVGSLRRLGAKREAASS